MKTVFLFVLVIACVLSVHARRELPRDKNGNVVYPDQMFMADDNGKLHYVNLAKKVVPRAVLETDIEFYLYTRNNPTTPEFLYSSSDINSIPHFDSSRRSIFVNHGWNNDHTSDVNTLVRNAALLVEDCNVFITDWSSHADTIDYPGAADAVVGVGDWVGKLVNNVMAAGTPRTDILIVGHSLGAHVAGRAGAVTSQLVNLVGMDPAGPLFSSDDFYSRIDQTDGDMVQIIHTNGGLLGFYDAMADADFYPNGGDWQPGCGLDLIGTCAHSRAYEYYSESIQYGGFSAVTCPSWADFESGACTGGSQSQMGGLNLNMGASGIYMLATSDAPPFSVGK